MANHLYGILLVALATASCTDGGLKGFTEGSKSEDGIGEPGTKDTTKLETNEIDGLSKLATSSGNSDDGLAIDVPGITSTNKSQITVAQHQEACNSASSVISKRVLVPFAPTNHHNCPWKWADNDAKKETHITARIEQSVGGPIDSRMLLCSVDITNSGTNFRYDDNFFLTLNDRLLASNLGGSHNAFWRNEDGHLMYKWSGLRGRSHNNFNEGEYCIEPGSCKIPDSEKWGTFRINLSSARGKMLLHRVTKENKLMFKLVVTGDNDYGDDCQHTGLPLNVDLKYVILKQ